jgi:hypothetical protein
MQREFRVVATSFDAFVMMPLKRWVECFGSEEVSRWQVECRSSVLSFTLTWSANAEC